MSADPLPPAAARQPVFNLPRVIVLVLAALAAIHAYRELILSDSGQVRFLLNFAFWPLRYSAEGADLPFPGGVGADVWTFVTYAFLHADITHLLVNCVWIAAFGAPLAWRLGAGRFLLFSAAGAVGGALLHLSTHWGDPSPMVGASAAISAHMAAAARFMFRGGSFGRSRQLGAAGYRAPAASIAEMVQDRRILAFLGVWFGVNLLFGLVGGFATGVSGPIAWEAHVGGFLVGLFLFPVFDPVGRNPGPPAYRPEAGGPGAYSR